MSSEAALRRPTSRLSASTDDLDALWADLAPVTVEEILGAWRGGDFSTGHVASTVLEQVRWHGKTFVSALDAKPLMCRGDDGELYSNLKAGGGGEASLWPVEFRGETTATMVYDRMPVFDHFKKVDDATLMGIMNGKLAGGLRRQRPLLLLAREGRPMKTTVAIVNEQGGDFAFEEVELDGPRADEVLVRIVATGPVPHRHHDEGLPARGDVPQRVRARGRGRRGGGRRRRQRHRRRRPRRAELPVLPHLREVQRRAGRLLRLDA